MILKHGYMTIDTMEFILGKAYVAWPVMAHLPNTGTIHGPITGSQKRAQQRGNISCRSSMQAASGEPRD